MPPKSSAKGEIKEEAVAVEEIVFERTEQEEQCDRIFKDVSKAFKKVQKTSNPDKLRVQLRDITTKLKEAKGLIKDFEREARADGMAVGELAARKKAMASQLNAFIEMKNEFGKAEASKADLIGPQGEIEAALEGTSIQTLKIKSQKEIEEIDKTLVRVHRIAEDTKVVGTNVASALNDQTKKLEDIMDQLNEIEFTMKKASKIIRDITRGLLTDKCIAFLLLLVVLGVVAIIVVKIIKPNRDKVVEGAQGAISDATAAINGTDIGSNIIGGAQNIANQSSNAVSGALARRLLMQRILSHVLELNATL